MRFEIQGERLRRFVQRAKAYPFTVNSSIEQPQLLLHARGRSLHICHLAGGDIFNAHLPAVVHESGQCSIVDFRSLFDWVADKTLLNFHGELHEENLELRVDDVGSMYFPLHPSPLMEEPIWTPDCHFMTLNNEAALAFQRAALCAARDEGRPNLTCIEVATGAEANEIRLRATDGFMAFQRRLPASGATANTLWGLLPAAHMALVGRMAKMADSFRMGFVFKPRAEGEEKSKIAGKVHNYTEAVYIQLDYGQGERIWLHVQPFDARFPSMERVLRASNDEDSVYVTLSADAILKRAKTLTKIARRGNGVISVQPEAPHNVRFSTVEANGGSGNATYSFSLPMLETQGDPNRFAFCCNPVYLEQILKALTYSNVTFQVMPTSNDEGKEIFYSSRPVQICDANGDADQATGVIMPISSPQHAS